ncbi:MAG TPA: ribosome biogenesis GTPase Der, partial [Dehalococcoidia bacterium]|nr:ribosome biogenesis GTPase Der [Dehalococcoidia bacterium]
MSIPVIAILGRPNVGKSTLFNRIAGKRFSIVSDIPGTTRDWISLNVESEDNRFILIDTGGIDNNPEVELYNEVSEITKQVLKESDAIILVVDSKEGLNVLDSYAAQIARKANKPCILAINKVDNLNRLSNAPDFYQLGIETIVTLSAYHGNGVSDLLDEISKKVTLLNEETEKSDSINIAIVGKPNVGKSSLFNSIIGQNRSIVNPVAGTTRDSIDTEIVFENKKINFIDTAGLRRRGKIEPGIEKYSVIRSIKSISRSDISLLVTDVSEQISSQDSHIAGMIKDAGKGCIIIANKWDLNEELSINQIDVSNITMDKLKFLHGSPIIFTSNVTKFGIETIFHKILEVYEEFNRTIPDDKVWSNILDTISKHPPPSKGKSKIIIKNAFQKSSKPPTFEIKIQNGKLLHFTYKRYIENGLRN